MGVLEHFARTILAAHEIVPRGWSTTLHKDAVTLNVGDHQVLKVLKVNGMYKVDVTLSETRSHLFSKLHDIGGIHTQRFPRKSESPDRQPLPLCYCCTIDRNSFLQAIPLIGDEYQKVFEHAVESTEGEIHSGKGAWAGSHSPGFIDYLRRELKKEIPQPDYCPPTGPSKKLANGRPDSSLAVEPKSGSEQVDGAQGELNSPPVVTVGAANEEPKKILDVEPELPGAALDAKVQLLLQSGKLAEPKGNANPSRKVATSDEFFRDPQVKAWVWQNADGVCELCRNAAPFKNAKGHPYLEVHHVIPLSEEGRDMHTNAVALCPNCHRECHFGEDWDARKERLYETVVRLVKA